MELQSIKLTVEEYFGCFINVKSRRRYIVDARKIYFGLCREFTKYSLATLGQSMDRDHATALHNIRSCMNLIETDKDFRDKYIALYKRVSKLKRNQWIPERVIIPSVIHPGRFRYGQIKSIRKIFNKRGQATKQRY